jgi:hypothetical protein
MIEMPATPVGSASIAVRVGEESRGLTVRTVGWNEEQDAFFCLL